MPVVNSRFSAPARIEKHICSSQDEIEASDRDVFENMACTYVRYEEKMSHIVVMSSQDVDCSYHRFAEVPFPWFLNTG